MRKFLMILAFLFIAIGIASCTGAQNITVTFEENGGEAVEDMVISINSTSINLPTPVREGFTFDGWYLDNAFTQPFTIAALLTQTGSVTLYAKWADDVVQYTITFESNGGSSVSAITQGAGTTVTAPTNPTKSGFTFGGWFSDSALTTAYTFGTMPAENITLYAKWVAEVTNQTITFESNGGSAVANLVAAIGSTIAAPTAPTKMGYTFGGWYSDSALTTAYTFTTMPADALTLYAKWTLNNYTISFEENGGSVVADKTQGYNTAVVAPTAPTKMGYTFGGWYSDSALTTAYTFGTMPAQNITLYAKWTLNNYTITFEENGGSAVLDITQGYNTAVVAPTAPTKMGYTFGGWYSDSALTTAYTFSTMPAQNITLYAKWTLNNYT
ncbi:MAG TPA: InlB B-repeat-containing protein, partial [Acholeplasmataceae bacterium]|nr:InlB B-repeat-containing protein [Acholeplasmataceae bacterium]